MTKQDFIDAVAERAGIPKRDAGAAVDALLETITDSLTRGDSVTFTGFGKFSTSARATRMGINPRTGEKVLISASTVPKFTVKDDLSERAAVLRSRAKDLERYHEESATRIESSRRTLREIASAA